MDYPNEGYGPPEMPMVQEHSTAQNVPVNAWYTENALVVETALPGVKPENVEIEVLSDHLVIRGNVTGSHGENKEYISQEWSLGPYERIYELPTGVDGEAANATFGGGLLVITLPRTSITRPAYIQLERVGAAQGLAQGHAGQPFDQEKDTPVPQYDCS